MQFSLSSEATIHVDPIGEERQPLCVIDNALPDPDAFVDHAATQPFGQIGAYYPGVRATLDTDCGASLCETVGTIARGHFAMPHEAWGGEYFFSIVTTSPAQLAPIQRLPHYDGVETDRLAVLLYLTPQPQGGTSFYRHRTTGFETIDHSRFPEYKSALENDVRRHGLPPAHYIDDGAPLFERIKTVDAVYNRMLVYRGINLHCSAIDETTSFSPDPRVGRLTINAFLTPAS